MMLRRVLLGLACCCAIGMLVVGACWAAGDTASEKLRRKIVGARAIEAVSVKDGNEVLANAGDLMVLWFDDIDGSIGVRRDSAAVSIRVGPDEVAPSGATYVRLCVYSKVNDAGTLTVEMDKNGGQFDESFTIPEPWLRSGLGEADLSKALNLMTKFVERPAEERFLLALQASTDGTPDYARNPAGAIANLCCLRWRYLWGIFRDVERLEVGDRRIYVYPARGTAKVWIFEKGGECLGMFDVQNRTKRFGEAIEMAKSIICKRKTKEKVTP